jgi:hypothetical protein
VAKIFNKEARSEEYRITNRANRCEMDHQRDPPFQTRTSVSPGADLEQYPPRGLEVVSVFHHDPDRECLSRFWKRMSGEYVK